MGKKSYNYHNPESYPSTGDDGGCCSVSCLRLSLYIFNAVFFLTGLVLIGVGLWTVLEKHPSLLLLTSGLYELIGYVIVIAGCVVILTTILGCCGLTKTSNSLVLTYSVILALILLVEVGVGVFAFYYRGRVSNELADNLQVKFGQEYGANNETTFAVDKLQISLKCCGIHSFEDWQASAWYSLPERRSNKVPDSCCISPGRYCGVRDHPSNINYTGCIERVDKIAGDQLVIAGFAVLGVALVQLIGTLLACVLHCKIKDFAYYA